MKRYLGVSIFRLLLLIEEGRIAEFILNELLLLLLCYYNVLLIFHVEWRMINGSKGSEELEFQSQRPTERDRDR